MSNCNCCCTRVLNLCKVSSCGDIDFGITAQIDGTHRLVTYLLGVQLTIEKDFISGEQIVYPLDDLNENYQYTVQLFDPEDKQIVISRNAVEYDCFQFTTIQGILKNTA